MKSSFIFFPFDLFGSPGTSAGVELLADAMAELLDDNARETKRTRARAYKDKIKLREVPFAKTADYSQWRQRARRIVVDSWSKGDFLAWLSGNHLGVLPVYDELSRRSDTIVVQLDAHLDVYHLDDCKEELSHGNFLLHVEDKLPPIVNLGSRELILPHEHVDQFYTRVFSTQRLHTAPDDALSELGSLLEGYERVFLDLDCDVFDPSTFPAVAQPVPLGIAPWFVLRVLSAIGWEKLCGIAISEFAPSKDREDLCLSTLLWLVEYILLGRYERPTTRDA